MRRTAHIVSERAYRTIKRDVVEGRFRPGERIDAAQLANGLASSITPVRAALHRLTGERLVDIRPMDGFYRAGLTEAGLRDLYAWNDHVLGLALDLGSPTDVQFSPDAAISDHLSRSPSPNDIAAVFAAIGGRSGSAQCAHAIAALNDQLHIARTVEPLVLMGPGDEWNAMLSATEPRAFKVHMHRYHRQRFRLASLIIQRLAEAGL